MEQTLYDMIGAEQLKEMVDRFYGFVEKDERISHLFKSDFETIKEKQLLFLTQFMGGPPLYNEKFGHPRMRMRHMPHAITRDAAVAWLENMGAAIYSLDIEEDLKEKLFASFPKLAQHMINS